MSLVSANSGGIRQGRRGGWLIGSAPPLPPEPRAEMVGPGGFCANPRWEWEVVRKWAAGQGPAQPPGRRLGAAIPEARREGGGRGRGVRQHGAGEEGQFGQPLAGLRGGDELPAGADHLLRRQRELLHHPNRIPPKQQR